MHPASGRLIPIDFGYSFETATQVLPVPELMPFCLTRQMAGAVLPHGVKAVLQEPCAAVLSALRAGSDILEGILGSFLRKPLLDWQRTATSLQSSKKGGGNRPDADTISAHGELKIRATQQKLAGCHPSKIMITELQARHGSKGHWSMLQQIVTRAAGCQNRELDVDSDLHSSEQASALLSMATSADILGRTWMGWRPWL